MQGVALLCAWTGLSGVVAQIYLRHFLKKTAVCLCATGGVLRVDLNQLAQFVLVGFDELFEVGFVGE